MIGNKNRLGFTLVELIVSIGIVVTISAGVMVMMSRGASNVHRGSFNATASNQASWIIAIMRRDIARSSVNQIEFKPDSGKKWLGKGLFSVKLNTGDTVSYSVQKKGQSQAFCRSESGGKKMFLGSECLSDLVVEQLADCFNVTMVLKDPAKKATDVEWNARIFPPVPIGLDRFWKPLSEIK